MPFYDFECERCGVFSELRTIAERNQPAPCPECDEEADRIISAVNLAIMPANARKAHAINERSAHEPRVRTAHRCASGCGCGKKGPDLVGLAQSKMDRFGKFQAPKKKRPWMLGH